MEYSRWAPHYVRLAAELNFPFEREEEARELLRSSLPSPAFLRPLERVASRLANREVVVVGLAPGAGPPPIWRRPPGPTERAVVAADGATVDCLNAGLVPDVIVTDLDGPVPAEVTANQRGSLVVVHAHGDNRDALAEWGPQFPGELVGSWAGPPVDGIINVGGFTDGDRAAFLAEHVGAAEILLWGFGFDHVDEPAATRDRKLAKLRWADLLLRLLAHEGRAPIGLWERDGTVRPYPGGMSEATTR